MGEIIFSIFIGGWMCLVGVLVIWWLSREEKKTKRNDKQNIMEGGH